METTRVSTRGQVVIPKDLRKAHNWNAGQELEVIDAGDGLLLKAKPSRKSGSWTDVVGCLGHLTEGKPMVTDADMHVAVRDMAARRYHRGRRGQQK